MTANTLTKPTAAQIRDAVAVLSRAWDPVPAGGWAEPTEEDLAEQECLGHGGCGCPLCAHHDHTRNRVCRVADCIKTTKYRVTAWRQTTSYGTGDPDDPNRDKHGYVSRGTSRQIHWRRTACGTVHARQLIDDDQAVRTTRYEAGTALSAEDTLYKIDSWRYEPDYFDQPELVAVADHLESAVHSVRWAARDRHQGKGVDHHVTWAQRSIARAAAATLVFADVDADRAAEAAADLAVSDR